MTPALLGQARDFLSKKHKPCILGVTGDLGVDRFVHGQVERISPEAPVPVLRVEKSIDKPACAANVLANMHELANIFPANIHVVGLVGKDADGQWLKSKLSAMKQLKLDLFEDSERPTTLKTRYMAGAYHQLLRVDHESIESISKKMASKVFDAISQSNGCKYWLLQDYAKGFFNPELLSKILQWARKNGVFTLVDPNRNTPADAYRGAGLITPNVAEAEVLLGGVDLEKGKNNKVIEEACKALKKKLDLELCIITRSQYGMTLLDKKNKFSHFPALARSVYDVTGAGDTLVAVIALCLASGASLDLACVLATAASSVVVAKPGTATASSKEILTELSGFTKK